ncbi:histidine--tRNA ligase [uncultured Jannaschia sp.]|uniref:histidine--tRNA ligase n=1 Tax=uncultured Jannaschia sp. TaxID=293347 RepID=UPI00263357F2|nr:histidine--tRNA ligase [uncultured Jannaschia sp.]
MARKDKPRRARAETPKGFRDYFGAEVVERKAMLDAIAEIYHRYGFDALESSAVETVEALGKFLPDVDRPNEGVFAWQEDADWLALRYDLTAPLARVYAQHRNELPTPYRRYAMGPVWRNEKPGPGRFRQFYQCDADTVGTASVAADAEICAMLCDTLKKVGINPGDYVVRVNNRKVLNGVLEAIGLEDEAHRAAVLRTIDKFDKVGETGVRELLGEGRKDQSGAFIDGVGLANDQIESVIVFLGARAKAAARVARGEHTQGAGIRLEARTSSAASERWRSDDERFLKMASDDPERLLNFETLNELRGLVGRSEVGLQGIDELEEMADLLDLQGYGPDRIVIDPSVVRGLGYYTGPVFEAELTFEIADEKGRPQRFGSVAGGGRYDDLVTRFTGQAVPATGVSIGVDRLLAALHAKGRTGGAAAGPVIVTVMDRDRMAEYQSICAMLRGAGIRAEVYFGNPKNFGNQLKYADRRGSPAAIIQGSDEAARDVVQVKDLVLGAKLSQDATVEEWKENPSQTEVPVGDLVTHLQRLLK